MSGGDGIGHGTGFQGGGGGINGHSGPGGPIVGTIPPTPITQAGVLKITAGNQGLGDKAGMDTVAITITMEERISRTQRSLAHQHSSQQQQAVSTSPHSVGVY